MSKSKSKSKWPRFHWGWLLLAAVLGCVLLTVDALRKRDETQQTALETQQLQSRAALARKNAALQDDTPRTPQAFRAEFPAYERRDARLADFLGRLAWLGPVPSTSFRQTALGPAVGVVGHTVSFTTTTRYSVWRDFMDDVLLADPALALTSLNLSRSDAATPLVRVQAVFTFHMQSPTAGTP